MNTGVMQMHEHYQYMYSIQLLTRNPNIKVRIFESHHYGFKKQNHKMDLLSEGEFDG